MCLRSLICSAALAVVALVPTALHAQVTDEGSAVLPLPPASIWQLPGTFTDVSGRDLELSGLAGRPVALVMFYGSCRHACPILFGDMLRLEATLSEATRAETRFVMVTIDPERDTLEALGQMAVAYELDLSRWMLLRAEPDVTLELATLLGVRYRGQTDGQISHSNLITILDSNGVIAGQFEGLRHPTQPIADAVEALATP